MLRFKVFWENCDGDKEGTSYIFRQKVFLYIEGSDFEDDINEKEKGE